MPITGHGWEILFTRTAVQSMPGDGSRRRTVGRYQVFWNGAPQTTADMAGMFAESRGPGDNSKVGKREHLRIKAGRYPLHTQNGAKYKTIGYAQSNMTTVLPRPGIELMNTGDRSEILIHPASGFLWAIGCINLCANLPNGAEMISYTGSRRRVIAVIENMKLFLGARFPNANGRPIPDAAAVIDNEP